jgi:hypothetical protein
MIYAGAITLIDHYPYRCVKIEDGTAYLKKLGDETRGRMRKFPIKMCPYIDENKELITPTAPKPKRRTVKQIKFMKTIKDEVELSVSNDLVYFVKEWIETIVTSMAVNAEHNARNAGHKRITAKHWYWLEIPIHGGRGLWPDHEEMCADIKAKDYED